MSDTMEANPRAVIGANMPPLAEQLPEETKEIEQRAADLIGGVERAKVTDRESAEKAALLAGLIKTHLTLIDETRETRKRPYLEAGRAVDAHFSAIAGRLATFDPRKKIIGGPLFTVLGMVDKFRREEEAKAEAERQRLEAEARAERAKAAEAERLRREAEERERRAAEEAAERVRKAEEEAARSKNRAAAAEAAQARAAQAQAEAEASERRLQADIARRREEAAAAELDRKAAASTATPIDSGLGVKASGRKVVIVTIDDPAKAARHCLRVAGPEMMETMQKIYDRLARAKVRNLPGATVREDSATQIRSA